MTVYVFRLAAIFAFVALGALPALAQGGEAICPFLECGPGDSRIPPPAAELSPSRQGPMSAPTRPSAPAAPIAPASPDSANAPLLATLPELPAGNCARLDFGTVCASSILPKWRDVTYGPANMFDGRLDTAWVEGVDGVGAGELITITFDGERVVSGISLLNGYHKSNDLFSKNGRITEIYLDTSDGQQLATQIADDPGEQVRYFDRPVSLKWIAIQVASAVTGTKYTDTAISEMRVLFE